MSDRDELHFFSGVSVILLYECNLLGRCIMGKFFERASESLSVREL
jgi:hypothetical protein